MENTNQSDWEKKEIRQIFEGYGAVPDELVNKLVEYIRNTIEVYSRNPYLDQELYAQEKVKEALAQKHQELKEKVEGLKCEMGNGVVLTCDVLQAITELVIMMDFPI